MTRRDSPQTAAVRQAVGEHGVYGYEILSVTGLPSGTVYPILRRLRARGDLELEAEDGDPCAGLVSSVFATGIVPSEF